MIAQLARDDFEDLKAEGLNPSLDDFDRLNQLALRITTRETTAANFPRIGWAGEVPFYQPTFAAIGWYLEFAERVPCDPETKNTFWFFALAHARRRDFFSRLTTTDEIVAAVQKWADGLPVTRDEVSRACHYAANGWDDAVSATKEKKADDETAAALSRLTRKLMEIAGVGRVSLSEALELTQDGGDALLGYAYKAMGREYGTDEKRLILDYNNTLAEIRGRLLKEKTDGQ